MSPSDLLEAVQTGGGWAVAVGEFYVIARLYKDMAAKDRKMLELLDQQNEILNLLRGQK